MTYAHIAAITESPALFKRIKACAAEQKAAGPGALQQWVFDHLWLIAASPSWADKWAYALAANPDLEDPGAEEAVITDADILTVVQGIVVGESAP